MKKYKELLGRTLGVQTESRNEKRMKRFVRNYLKGIGLKPFSDDKGNIYCNKGDMRKYRPYVVAHLDTVHKVNKNVMTFFNDEFYYAFDMKTMEQAGVGGDDKVGIWAALAAITEFDNISTAFFVEEEIGCIGSNAADLSKMKKVNWMAQLDRRDAIDFITYNMASDEFIKDMEPIAFKHGLINTSQSTTTDVSTLFRRRIGVSSVNIASGYYFPHSNREVVNIDDAMNSLDLLFNMILKHGDKRYPHLPPEPKKQKKHKKVGGFKSLSEGRSRWDAAQYVGGQIRIWNAFYGCFEWRDYSGNMLCYEGIGLKARFFSRRPNNLKSDTIEAPDQKAIPITINRLPAKDSAKTVTNIRTKANLSLPPASKDDQEEIDFHDAEDKYWDDISEKSALEALLTYEEEKAATEKEKEREESIKTYHNAEMEYAELSQARKQIDSVLYMYGYSFHEFTGGLIPDDHAKNMSASLHYDNGHTLSYYERIFGVEGLYIYADHSGEFTDFLKQEGDIPF